MTQSEVLNIGEQFIEFDKNHDGFIDFDEFQAVLK